MTACTATGFGRHDYSQPPHNIPDDPRDADECDGPCQAQSARPPLGSCQHERSYGLVIYQIGSHEWIRIFACTPCMATLRVRHRKLGPGGTEGIARIWLATGAYSPT